jgi:CheY-like chemotaxis protein/predicted transcriptional regulator
MTSQENGGGCSFSIVVMRRILNVLADAGSIRKTNLAGRTGLNYPNCVRYIELLQLLGWVRTSNDGSYSVVVTEQGRHYRSLLSGLLDGTKNSETIVSSKLIESIGDAAKNPRFSGAKMKQYQEKDVYNVMLVDDEEDILLTFKACLKNQGFNVRTFSDPKEALENIGSVDASYYDLVITDIRMKKMNGLHLYQWIRSINPNLRVIFVTALDAIEEMISILPGISSKDVIRKPVDNPTFVEFVKKAISEVRSEQLETITASAK